MPIEETPDSPRILGSFVDDEAALLVARGGDSRDAGNSGMVLPADDLDFAGWCMSERKPVEARLFAVATKAVAQREVCAENSYEEEAGISAPYRGGHRWWVLGMASAACSMLVAGLMFSFANSEAAKQQQPNVRIMPQDGHFEPALEVAATVK